MMSHSWTNIDSPHPLTPAPMPSPATNRIEHGLGQGRRPSQVGEFIEKLNFKLKRLFGNRRGSAEDVSPSWVRRSSSTSCDLHPTLECDPGDSAWNGPSQLPNVSEYFDAHGEVCPSSFYNTADWVTFQEAFQARLHSPAVSDWDPNRDNQGFLRAHDNHEFEFEPRIRKDSQFSFSDFLKSRRPSKDKGKGRMVMDETAKIPQEEAVDSFGREPLVVVAPCLAQIGVLPRVSMEATSPLTSKEMEDVPQAEFTSLECSTQSLHRPASPTPAREEESKTNKTVVQQTSPCHAISPFLWPQAHSASPVSSVSSVDVPLASIRPQMARRIVRAAAPRPATDSIATDSRGHSVPIIIPSNHSSRRSSSVIHGSARPEAHLLSPTPSENSLPSSTSASLTSLLRHSDRPDSFPLTPSLQPTRASSPLTMQTLSLGPPKHGVQSPWQSSENMFRMSCESLETAARSLGSCSLPSPAMGIGQTRNSKPAKDQEEDRPDFSITHPAPPAAVQVGKGVKRDSTSGDGELVTRLVDTRWWEECDEEELERLYM